MKFLHTFLFVVFAFLSLGLFGQTTVTVGTGTATDYNFPLQPYFNYGWSSQIYTATEIGTSGTINSIAFYVNNSGSSYTLDNQKIYMRQTTSTQHADKYYPGTTGFTLVYSGSITIGASGWKTITLSTPFSYSNASNLEILVESRDGSTFTSAVQARYTTKSDYRTKYDYNDYSFPSTWYAGGRVAKLPNIQFVINTCTTVAGTVSASASTVCSGNTANLTLTGQTAGQGVQWQESTDNTTFTDISGATSTTYSTPSLTSTKYYRAKVGSGSCIVYSNVQTITVSGLPTAPTAGNNGALCTGSTLNLTASTITGATYVWTGPNSFTSTSQNPSIANITSAGAGTYSVTATVNGCTSVAGTTNVTVNAIPSTPTAGNNGVLCEGSTLNLLASTITGATYAWTGPNSFTSTSQNPSIATITTAGAGTYSVTATVNGCTSVAGTTNVTVNAIPSTPTAGNNGVLCEGSTLNLLASTITGATYAWTGPNSFTSTSQNPSIATITTAGAGTYSVSATVNGCTSVAGTTSVTVNAIPPAPTAGNNGPFCAGSPLSLTANTIVGAVYSWTGPNGFTSTLQNPQVSNVAFISMSGDYTLTVTVGDCPSVSSTTSVMVKDIPSAPAVTSTQTVCQGETLILTGESNSYSTYEWTGPNNFSSQLLNVVVTTSVSTLNAGDYKLYSKVDGCKSVGSTVTVSVASKPIVNAGTNSSITFGSSTQIGTVSTSGYTYSWSSLPSGFVSSISNPTVNPSTTTTYTLLVTNSQGCTNSANVTVTVNIPPLQISTKVFNAFCSVDNSGAIEATVTGGVPPYTYKWNTGHDTKIVSGLVSGNYTLEVSDASSPAQTLTRNISVGISPELSYVKGLKYSSDGVLTKIASTGNENSWLSSVNSFVGDGWISYKITSKSIKYMIGFSYSHHKEGNHDLGTPIDFGVEQDYSQENLYKANTSVTYTSYQIGDVIKIAREGSFIKYYRNGNLLSSFTDNVNPNTILYLEATMTDQDSYLSDLSISFCNADINSTNNLSYAIPFKKLDGGYYETDKGVLRFVFDEEYSISSTSNLNYTIYDKKKNVVMTTSSQGSQCLAPNTQVSYGTNKIDLNFTNSCLNTGEYYIIEVKNSKNESVFMRFKYVI